MNKKGFTLIELLAVIAIIAIILTMAVPSYVNITKSTTNKVYESKIEAIKAKAELYASDNNISNGTVSVSKLVSEGYLEPDNTGSNENEQISNPNGGYLDCYIVNISKDSGEYNISVNENNDCSVANNDAITSKINVYAYTYSNGKIGELLGTNNDVKWSKEDVLLYADLTNVESELQDNNITWTVGTSSEEKNKTIIQGINNDYNSYSNEKLVTASVFLNNEYAMTINTKTGKVTKTINVKIDKEKPYVETSINDKWENANKTVTLTGSDGTGSGIDKFYVGKDKTQPIASQFNIEAIDNKGSIAIDVGTYYAYSIDKAGNISDAKQVNVSNIDKTGPICKYAVIPATYKYNNVTYPWSHEDITITYGCSTDSQSGCKTTDYTKTYTEAKQETINWEIEDNLGNKTECSQSVTINIDKTQPTITAKSNPLSLGAQDYDFTSNITATFSPVGGKVTCDPAVSKKTGTYDVTCTATGNNGLITTVKFSTRHSYPASWVNGWIESHSWSCGGGCNNVVDWNDGRNGHSGTFGWCSDGREHACCWYSCKEYGTCGCNSHGTDTTYHSGYYYCPNGGTLSGSTCNY
jgi:type IV pilus assembly protein PilA